MAGKLYKRTCSPTACFCIFSRIHFEISAVALAAVICVHCVQFRNQTIQFRYSSEHQTPTSLYRVMDKQASCQRYPKSHILCGCYPFSPHHNIRDVGAVLKPPAKLNIVRISSMCGLFRHCLWQCAELQWQRQCMCDRSIFPPTKVSYVRSEAAYRPIRGIHLMQYGRILVHAG